MSFLGRPARRDDGMGGDAMDAHHRIEDLLGSMRKKGVRLWLEGRRLRYKAPKNALTQAEIEVLREFSGQIVTLQESTARQKITDPRLEVRPRLDSAPLSFSQLQHWNLYQLRERRAFRHLASVKRLCGRLNVDALRRSVSEVVRRHDTLRTRIVVCDGTPIQEIAESGDWELKVEDLTAVSESCREVEINRRIEQVILEPVDVAVGPLFEAKLLRFKENEHVLIVAMEHIISDEWSLDIFLRDLFTAYAHILKGHAISLPEIPIQFADYAVWQRSAQKSWIEKHGAYWNERLSGCERLRFPVDGSLPSEARLGWRIVPVQIGKDLNAELHEWCRLRRTTVVMSVCSAYVGLVLRWCNVSETVIRYESNGRVSQKLENAIGYFTSPLFLRIKLLEDDSFADLLNQTREEYCRAYEHADSSYMEAQLPRPEFARNTAFNWIPQGSKIVASDLDGSEDAINCSAVPFINPRLKNLERDTEPFIVFFDSDDGIVGGVWFPLNRFSVSTMERFGRNFLVFIRGMLRQPEGRVKDISLL